MAKMQNADDNYNAHPLTRDVAEALADKMEENGSTRGAAAALAASSMGADVWTGFALADWAQAIIAERVKSPNNPK